MSEIPLPDFGKIQQIENIKQTMEISASDSNAKKKNQVDAHQENLSPGDKKSLQTYVKLVNKFNHSAEKLYGYCEHLFVDQLTQTAIELINKHLVEFKELLNRIESQQKVENDLQKRILPSPVSFSISAWKNDDNEEERIEDDNKKRNEDNANIETINEKNIKSKFSNDLSYPFVKTFHFQSQPNQSKYSDLISIFNKEKECPDREQYKLNLLIPFGLDPKQYRDNDSYVLVLGSGGLIGSALEKILRDHGYKTLHVLSRHHLDLRIPGSLNIFDNINISFVYFLAYEVGGAKFLQVPEYQHC